MRTLNGDGVVVTFCDYCGTETNGWMFVMAHSSNTAPANMPEYLDYWCAECAARLIDERKGKVEPTLPGTGRDSSS